MSVVENKDVYMGPTVYEAAEILIRRNNQEIKKLQDEIKAARKRMYDPHFFNMLEAERIANQAEKVLKPIKQGETS